MAAWSGLARGLSLDSRWFQDRRQTFRKAGDGGSLPVTLDVEVEYLVRRRIDILDEAGTKYFELGYRARA
jgi:hypothetical protein